MATDAWPPRWLSGKESTCQCGFNPWIRKIPWRRKWQPTQVFLPEGNPRDRGAWQAIVHGIEKSQTLLSNRAHTPHNVTQPKCDISLGPVSNLPLTGCALGAGHFTSLEPQFSHLCNGHKDIHSGSEEYH